ncbi:hypothetical protein [Paenibacillus sp. FSL H8-0537]|uniref:hypothetical protein n=1 Tax=Paenibacillus sp. FSL H8-0537 TaxID=2921399 RepID=UPI0031014F01
MFKLALRTILIAVLSLSVTASAFATDIDTPLVPAPTQNLEDVATVIENVDGSLEIIPFDPESYIQQAGLEKPSPNAQLVSIKRVSVTGDKNNPDNNMPSDTSSKAFGLGLFVKKTTVSTGTSPNRIARGRILCSIDGGCSNLKVEINTTDSIYSEFSADVSVGNDIVGAGVGYTIGAAKSVSISGSEYRAVAKGKFLILDAYPRIEITGFEVWDRGLFSTTKVGSGSSWRSTSNDMDFVVWIQ